MGRGKNRQRAQLAATRRGEVVDADTQVLRQHQWIIGKWESRIARAGVAEKETLVEQTQAKARAVRALADDPKEQRALIRAAQDAKRIIEETEGQATPQARALNAFARQVNDRARELFILCHTGFIEQTISRQVHQLRAEDAQHAREVLRQEAWRGLNKGIDRYDFSEKANPLTYTKNWMRAEISDAIEREGGEAGVRLKSKSNNLGKKVEALAKEIENEGRQVTIAELAERLKASPDRIAEVLPHAHGHAVRLDAPVKTDDGASSTMGSLIIDPSQQVEEPVLDADVRERVRQAVADIERPFHRRVLELYYGLSDGTTVEQKDLFDGVYRDKRGRAYSAESSVIADRQRRGEKVIKKSQRELNELYKAGKLSFEPGTAEAHELARVQMPDYDPNAPFEKALTIETGIPPTSGTIQEAKRIAEEEMRSNPILSGIQPRYRGDDELENSETAREQVRNALRRKGVIDADEERKLMAGRAQSGGKSKLRLLAEEHGLVDKTSGRLRLANIAPYLDSSSLESTDELAEVMSASA